MKAKKKTLLTVLAFVLVIALSVGGTIAYLTHTTDTITNTFTVGNVKASLNETKPADFTAKMVPGDSITKNPTAGIVAGSEASWLFVRIQESANLDSFISYTVANGWTALEGHDGYFYKQVNATDAAAGVTYPILAGDTVSVKGDVTQAMMDGLATATNPTLTFTACAVQSANLDTAADAFAQAPNAFVA